MTDSSSSPDSNSGAGPLQGQEVQDSSDSWERSPAETTQAFRGRRTLEVTQTIELAVLGLFILAVFSVLRVTSAFVLPIVFGTFLALLLDPAALLLRKLGFSRTVAATFLLVLMVAAGGLTLRFTLLPAQEYLLSAPQKLHRLEHRLSGMLRSVEEVSQAAEKVSDMASSDDESRRQEVSVSSEPTLKESLFNNTQEFLGGSLVALAVAFFFLASGGKLAGRWAEFLGDKARYLHMGRQIQRDVSSLLFTVTWINMILGVGVGLVCWWSGLPNPVLWGMMAALFNYVPYLGAALGILVVGVLSILTFDSPVQALYAPLGYLALTSLEGTFLTPMVLGRRFSLHPAVVLLALLLWSYIWGVAGALLAVPMLLVLKGICENVPRLNRLGQALAR